MSILKKKKNKWSLEQLKKVPVICGIVLLCVSFFAGAAIEGLYELNVHRRELKGGNIAQDEKISDHAVQIENILSEDGESRKSVTISLKERYIHKLKYSYSSEENFRTEIVINTKDIYDNPENRVLKEAGEKHLNTSIVNIEDYVTKISMILPEEVEIHDFEILNDWDWNWYRVGYIGVFVFLFLCIVVFRKEFGEKIENGFLVIILSAGILFIAIQPPKCSTWDEHIHFIRTFQWLEQGEVEQTVSENYIYYNPETADAAPFLSKEEKALQIEYLNRNTNVPGASIIKDKNELSAFGELHMTVAVKLAQLLHLPFYVQFVLGKLANLFVYSICMYWAIRIVPIGKKFLTAIALMPTMLLQATSYSYDTIVAAFIALGFCMIVEELYEINRKITWKKQAMIALAFIIGCCSKPVYMPLCAIMLIMPKEKFSSKSQMYICKGGAVILSIGMLMTMLLPAVGGSVAGDPRGGATDVGQQLALVASHPISYFLVFLQVFFRTANQYIFGFESLSSLAYAGMHPVHYLIPVFCVGVALTEKKNRMVLNKKTMIWYKGVLAFLVMIIVGLIWSALYICFTPVGSTSIAGVQPRYYVPLLFPVYMFLYNCKMEGKWKEENYNMIMFLIVLFITFTTMNKQFFIPYCL